MYSLHLWDQKHSSAIHHVLQDFQMFSMKNLNLQTVHLNIVDYVEFPVKFSGS